jgi:hypothetical protein
MPRRRASAQIRAIGSVIAVGDVMWLTTISRVRSVAAANTAATTSSVVVIGCGSRAIRGAPAPARSNARCQIRNTAPYS